jgi:hypothetical protein
MWPFGGLFAGAFTGPDPDTLTIEKAFVDANGTLYGPVGWSANKISAGQVQVNFGKDCTADGTAVWCWYHSGTSVPSNEGHVASLTHSVLGSQFVNVYIRRASDGAQVEQGGFYIYFATGTAATVKRGIVSGSTGLFTGIFGTPSGWSASRTGTGTYTITTNETTNLTPFAAECAFTVQAYGNASQGTGVCWTPATTNTNAEVETHRTLDGAAQDRDHLAVWIDTTALSAPVAGAQINGASFIGGQPAGWSSTKLGTGLYDVNIAQGNQPKLPPVQDGLAIMCAGETGFSFGAGVMPQFDGGANVLFEAFRFLDHGPSDYDIFVTTIEGNAPS